MLRITDGGLPSRFRRWPHSLLGNGQEEPYPQLATRLGLQGLATAPGGAALGSWLTCPWHHLPHYGPSVSLCGEEDRWGALSTAAVTVAPRPHTWRLLVMVASLSLSWKMSRAASGLNRWLHPGTGSQVPGECGPPTLTCHKPQNRISNERCNGMEVSTTV